MALTPDAIPTNEQMVESLADRLYHPYKKQIWVGGAVFFGAIVAVLAVREVRASRQADMWDRYHQAGQLFNSNPFGDPDTAAARKQVDALQILLKDYPDDTVTPFAMQQLVKAQTALGEYESALKTLGELRSRFKDFPLNTLPADADASGRARSLSEKLEDAIKRERDWSTKNTYVHHWPTDERSAFVETTAGNFWLSFYSGPDEAPKHVESFVRHAKQGDYNGTQVYSLIQTSEGGPERFECGSRASGLSEKGGVRDPSEHDRDEPTDTIESEDSRYTVRHVYRVVSAARMDSGDSAMRFVVVAKRDGQPRMNGEYTPFAAVMEREKSLETIDLIGRSPTYHSNAETRESPGTYRMRDHPYPAIVIRRVTIWSNEKLEDGHTWDTSRAQAAKNEPEPWEATLTSPKPEEFNEPAKPKDEGAAPKKDGVPAGESEKK
jgi:cyclophilin family peptidyl-prolyl cis-trans isomerase